jgi:hypothetical protein
MSVPTENATGAPPGFAWPLVLGLTTVIGTLATACMMPFVAVAVIIGATMAPRRAVAAMAAIWLSNQLLGFTLQGFPATPYVLAWAGALGAASLAAMMVARAVAAGTGDLVAVRLAAAFAAAFIAYEALLFAFATAAGGLQTFTPDIVTRIAVNDAIWFAALLGLRIGLTRAAPRLFGTAPALRFAR